MTEMKSAHKCGHCGLEEVLDNTVPYSGYCSQWCAEAPPTIPWPVEGDYLEDQPYRSLEPVPADGLVTLVTSLVGPDAENWYRARPVGNVEVVDERVRPSSNGANQVTEVTYKVNPGGRVFYAIGNEMEYEITREIWCHPQDPDLPRGKSQWPAWWSARART